MKHELDMCCGTTCDKQVNLEYVKRLEQEREDLINMMQKLIDAANQGDGVASWWRGWGEAEKLLDSLEEGHQQ